MKNTKKILIILTAILFLSLLGISVNAVDYEDYAPILYFEGEETCYPIDADFHIINSDLYEYTEESTTLKQLNPNEYDLQQYANTLEDSKHSFLDNREGTVDDYNKIISDAKSYESTYGNTVYYKIHNTSSITVIQYWMFYAFNSGELNQHEGDWEMVQVVIPASGEKWVAYSQHHSGQRATWDLVEKEGNHIKVYVSRGSHANFLRSYSGKLGVGMGSDYVGANGRILRPGDYELVNLDNQIWLNYDGLWGELDNVEDLFTGQAGSQDPKFREDGSMWDNPVSWGQGLPAASSMGFILDWFVYNLVLIYVAITVVILALIFFKIYRRHKKYGLGPRKVSLLYIDGLNLHTVGNILCIVGIIIAIIGLFSNWYLVSGNINVEGVSGTGGKIDILLLDGTSGLQINIPGAGGSITVGAFVIPFSIFIGVGLLFTIIATIGINKSSKLGWKYISRGIRLFVPIIILLIGIMLIGSFISEPEPANTSENYASEMLSAISNAPFGGEKTIQIAEEDTTGYLSFSWGLGLGGYLLLLSGIVMLVAGILEFSTNKIFFEPKVPYKKKHEPISYQTPVITKPSREEKPKEAPLKDKKKKEPKDKSNYLFCPNCGKKLNKDAKFCADCGSEI